MQDQYAAEREALAQARSAGVTYLVGRSRLRAAPGSSWPKVRPAEGAGQQRAVGPGGREGCRSGAAQLASLSTLRSHPELRARPAHCRTAPRPGPSLWQRLLVEGMYGTLAANSRLATASYGLPTDTLLQLGVDYTL